MALPPHDGSDARGGRAGDARPTDWAALSVAIVVPLLFMHLSVVRPTTAQLQRVTAQVARLEAQMLKLNALAETADETAGLMESLAGQSGALDRARVSLAKLAVLGDRLAQGVRDLNRLEGIAQRVEHQSELLDQADDALASLATIPARLESSIDRASRAAPTVEGVNKLRMRLAEARALSTEALETVEAVVADQGRLIADAGRIQSAHDALDGLAGLEARLNAPTLDVEASQDRLSDLVSLKEAVIAETENLPAALETFELMVDLSADAHRAAMGLGSVQRLMADLMLLEPSIARIAGMIQPVIDRSSLGTLGGAELRLVLRELRERRTSALAEKTQSTDSPRLASEPTVGESK